MVACIHRDVSTVVLHINLHWRSSICLKVAGQRIEPPQCGACNGLIRPGVVWFGEMLPEIAWNAGLAAAENCDVFLSIGTSGMVYPAAELPLRALGRGSTVVHINPVPFEVGEDEHFLQGPATHVMDELIAAAFS